MWSLSSNRFLENVSQDIKLYFSIDGCLQNWGVWESVSSWDVCFISFDRTLRRKKESFKNALLFYCSLLWMFICLYRQGTWWSLTCQCWSNLVFGHGMSLFYKSFGIIKFLLSSSSFERKFAVTRQTSDVWVCWRVVQADALLLTKCMSKAYCNSEKSWLFYEFLYCKDYQRNKIENILYENKNCHLFPMGQQTKKCYSGLSKVSTHFTSIQPAIKTCSQWKTCAVYNCMSWLYFL